MLIRNFAIWTLDNTIESDLNSLTIICHSTFAEVELPNLNAKEVKEVKIFVGVDLDIKPK